jgi:hypothetical protein
MLFIARRLPLASKAYRLLSIWQPIAAMTVIIHVSKAMSARRAWQLIALRI